MAEIIQSIQTWPQAIVAVAMAVVALSLTIAIIRN